MLLGSLELLDYPSVDEIARYAIEKASKKYKIDPITVVTFYNHQNVEDYKNFISEIGKAEAKSHILGRYLSYIFDLRFTPETIFGIQSEKITTPLSTIENYKSRMQIFLNFSDLSRLLRREAPENNVLLIFEKREPLEAVKDYYVGYYYFEKKKEETPSLPVDIGLLKKKYPMRSEYKFTPIPSKKDNLQGKEKIAIERKILKKELKDYFNLFESFDISNKYFSKIDHYYADSYEDTMKKVFTYYNKKRSVTPKLVKKYVYKLMRNINRYGEDEIESLDLPEKDDKIGSYFRSFVDYIG